jgi:hypothetical protein
MVTGGREWVRGAALRAPGVSWLSRSLALSGTRRLLSVAVPLLLILAHAGLYWGWIVDDAGISFAYARNLVDGHGLVSQPGFEPVEGYSNPLWVALQTPFLLAGLFDPALTPKLLSLALIGGAFVVLYRAMSIAAAPLSGRWMFLPALPLLLLSLNTSFVAWTTSGLENPLFAFELSLLLYLSLRAVLLPELSPAMGAALGLTVAAAALTRPDGVLLGLAYPALIAGQGLFTVTRQRHLPAYAIGLGVPLLTFLAFRLAYFGELFPNTYYAKGGITLAHLGAKTNDLLDSVLGFNQTELQWLVVAALTAGVIVLRRPQLWTAASFTAFAAAGVLLLPPDWMRENRFCSIFVPAFYVMLSLELLFLAQGPLRQASREATLRVAAVVAGVFLASTGGFLDRSIAFSREPTVPMSDVEVYFGDRFESYSRLLGVEDPSLLTLDVGGLLYGSDLRVYDLVGLTDKTIARTLQKDQQAFYDYVFAELKPTFIHTHGVYAVYAALDNDSRLRKLYRPICEQIDPWVEHVWGFYWYSGDYVLREAALDDAVVGRMAQSCRELPYPGN